MPLFSIDEPQPKLNPPAQCWREDMPENHEPQLVPPQLRWRGTQNDIYLEVPRYSMEIMWWILPPVSFLMIVLIFFLLYSSSCNECMETMFVVFFIVITIFLFIWFGLKLYFIEPRNQPFRLNRKRQKLYMYNYNRSWLPWLKWLVSVRVYHWADIHGEISFSPTPGDRGYRLYGAVCEPGTCNVVERFLLAREGEEREQLNQIWSYLCMYMQNDNDFLPPRNAEPPAFWRPRKADQWPAEMEHESTTAPGDIRS